MAITAALEAQNARVRDALILPYKRRIASWIIRSDIWLDAVKPGSKDAAAREQALTSATAAVGELDDQVSNLSDIIFPAEGKSKAIVEAELTKMKASYADIRVTLLNITAAAK